VTLGKAIRLGRIFGHPSGRLLSVAIDHFVGYPKTMTDGLGNLPRTLRDIATAQPDAVTMYEGAAAHSWHPYAARMALIIQLGCFTADDRIVETLGSVEGAVRLGADAVARSIGVRGDREGYHLRTLSQTVSEAEPFGMPVIAHIYPRTYDDGVPRIVADASNIAWAVRCGIECGADLIKVTYPGDPEAFREIIEACPVPIVAAGGPPTETFEEALLQADAIISAGASGLTVGRNVWSHGRKTTNAILAYKSVVHDRLPVATVMDPVRGITFDDE
jgi:class I fructose-bisphosphate aldolase